MDSAINKVHILPTADTPEIILDPNGIIKIKGQGKVLDNTVNFLQVMAWLDKYMTKPAEITYVNLCFEYLNSYCTAKLVTILKKISDIRLMNKKLVVNWYYEQDDEDILERGEQISETFKIDIVLIVTNDIKYCC